MPENPSSNPAARPAPNRVERGLPHAARAQPFSPRALYRAVAIAEAVTWTLLIGGMILKYLLRAGELGVQVGGFLHGLVFLAYGMTAVLVGLNQRWSVRLIGLALLTAVVPYATIPFDRRLERTGRLDGPWRTTATEDERDHTPLGAALRWVLNHPVLLAVVLVLALAGIFAILLALGPPGGR